MNSLTFSIEFIENNKKIWTLRCDKKTFDEVNILLNAYLTHNVANDDIKDN